MLPITVEIAGTDKTPYVRLQGLSGAHHHSVKVMKLIQKLRSARQRFPRLADSTFGVMVEASSLVSLSWCVLRMVAAQDVVKFSIRIRHTYLELMVDQPSRYLLHFLCSIHYPCDDEVARKPWYIYPT